MESILSSGFSVVYMFLQLELTPVALVIECNAK